MILVRKKEKNGRGYKMEKREKILQEIFIQFLLESRFETNIFYISR